MIDPYLANAFAISNCPKLQFPMSPHLNHLQCETSTVLVRLGSTKKQNLSQGDNPRAQVGNQRELGKGKKLV